MGIVVKKKRKIQLRENIFKTFEKNFLNETS